MVIEECESVNIIYIHVFYISIASFKSRLAICRCGCLQRTKRTLQMDSCAAAVGKCWLNTTTVWFPRAMAKSPKLFQLRWICCIKMYGFLIGRNSKNLFTDLLCVLLTTVETLFRSLIKPMWGTDTETQNLPPSVITVPVFACCTAAFVHAGALYYIIDCALKHCRKNLVSRGINIIACIDRRGHKKISWLTEQEIPKKFFPTWKEQL